MIDDHPLRDVCRNLLWCTDEAWRPLNWPEMASDVQEAVHLLSQLGAIELRVEAEARCAGSEDTIHAVCVASGAKGKPFLPWLVETVVGLRPEWIGLASSVQMKFLEIRRRPLGKWIITANTVHPPSGLVSRQPYANVETYTIEKPQKGQNVQSASESDRARWTFAEPLRAKTPPLTWKRIATLWHQQTGEPCDEQAMKQACHRVQKRNKT